MMRHACADFRRRLGAADVESAIELNGIEVDDFAARSFGQAECESRFADTGRSGNDEDHYRRVRVMCVRSSSRCRTLRRCSRQ